MHHVTFSFLAKLVKECPKLVWCVLICLDWFSPFLFKFTWLPRKLSLMLKRELSELDLSLTPLSTCARNSVLHVLEYCYSPQSSVCPSLFRRFLLVRQSLLSGNPNQYILDVLEEILDEVEALYGPFNCRIFRVFQPRGEYHFGSILRGKICWARPPKCHGDNEVMKVIPVRHQSWR